MQTLQEKQGTQISIRPKWEGFVFESLKKSPFKSMQGHRL